jgi:hypothetical protein
MHIEQLCRRLPLIARLVLGGYRAVVGQANVRWLELHRDRNDWEPDDIVRIREMLPTALHWLLRDGDDE